MPNRNTLTEACAAFRNFDRVRRRNPVTPTTAHATLSEAYSFLIFLSGWSVDSDIPL